MQIKNDKPLHSSPRQNQQNADINHFCYLNNKKYRPKTRTNPVYSRTSVDAFAFDLVDCNIFSLSRGN